MHLRRWLFLASMTMACLFCSSSYSYAAIECKKIGEDMKYYIQARTYQPNLKNNHTKETQIYCNSVKVKSLINNFDIILAEWSKQAELCKSDTPNLYPVLKQFRELHKSVTGICTEL